MTELTFRDATLADVDYIARNMRAADREELETCHGRWTNVPVILMNAISRSSQCWAGEADGVPIMLFGVVPISLLGEHGSVGSPWLLGTPEIDHHAKAMVKTGREFVVRMHEEYRYLVNYVDVNNGRSRRWLRRIGFVLYPPVPYGLCGKPFQRFDRSIENV